MYETFDAEKYLKAQEGPYGSSYESALSEIRNGQKQGHWIWYIFPQLAGLGRNSTSQYYAIRNLEEAKAYLNNTVLRERLIEISEALLSLDKDIRQIMWSPDDLKVRSCMTLFREADPSIGVFQQVIDKFFGGKPDHRTLQLLGRSSGAGEKNSLDKDKELELKKELSFSSSFGEKKIKLYCGDITEYTDRIDLLTVSAFKNNYVPTIRSMIGTLYREWGISVAKEAQNPFLDLRDFCGCWISRRIQETEQNPYLGRIGCLEMSSFRSDSSEKLLVLIQSYFQTLNLLALQNIPLERVVLPLLGTGDQAINPRRIVVPLINETLQYLRRSPATKEIVFIERAAWKTAILQNALEKSYSIMNETMEEEHRHENKQVMAFISYEKSDRSIADLLCRKMEERGIQAWYAPRDIHQGSYALAIVNAISKCTHFITIVSLGSMGSDHVLNEIDLAFDQLSRGIVLLPFRVDYQALSAEFSYYLKRQQWMEAQKPPLEVRIEEFIEKVFF